MTFQQWLNDLDTRVTDFRATGGDPLLYLGGAMVGEIAGMGNCNIAELQRRIERAQHAAKLWDRLIMERVDKKSVD